MRPMHLMLNDRQYAESSKTVAIKAHSSSAAMTLPPQLCMLALLKPEGVGAGRKLSWKGADAARPSVSAAANDRSTCAVAPPHLGK